MSGTAASPRGAPPPSAAQMVPLPQQAGGGIYVRNRGVCCQSACRPCLGKKWWARGQRVPLPV